MKTLTLILTAACLLVLTRHAHAGWTNDPWNGMVTVCDAPGEQYNPVSTFLAGGRTLVVWQDEPPNTDDVRTYYQVLDYDGRPLRTINGERLFTGNSLNGGKLVVSDGQGGAIVIVNDNRNYWNIYGQRLDSLGNRLWGDNGLPIAVWQQNGGTVPTDLVSDSQGNFFVGWYEGWPDANVYVQKFNVNGQRLWGEYGAPVCTDPASQTRPQLVPDDQGGVEIAWADNRNSPPEYFHIYFQHLDSTGSPLLVTNGIPLRNINGNWLPPGYLEGVSDGQGGSLWHACTEAQLSYYFILRVNGAGHTLWYWNNWNLYGHEPYDLLRHPDGTYYASVGENRPGNPGVFVYHFDVNGNQLWGNLGRKLGDVGALSSSVLTSTPNGIICSGEVIHGSIEGKQALRADSTGDTLWVSPYALGSSWEDFIVINSVSDSADGAVYPIQDQRVPGDWRDISAQRVNFDGTLGTPNKTRINLEKTIESLPEKSPTFILDQAGLVKIEVFDIQGRKVFDRDEGMQLPGPYTIRSETWDLASGVYMVKMMAAGKEQVRKIVITR
jgi:hypothetical protein